MIINDPRPFIVKLEEGETPKQLLIALAMAAFERAEPLGDDGIIDGDYVPGETLTIGEAADAVRGNEMMMMFKKGRMCLIHAVVDALRDRPGEFLVRFSLHETDLEGLMARADVLMEETFGRPVPVAESAPAHRSGEHRLDLGPVEDDVPVILDIDLDEVDDDEPTRPMVRLAHAS